VILPSHGVLPGVAAERSLQPVTYRDVTAPVMPATTNQRTSLVATTRAEQEPETLTYQHDLLVHSSTDELAAVAVPFLRAGLEVGDTAVIATDGPSAAVLRDELGTGDGVVVLPREGLYGVRPPAAITVFRKLAEEHSAQGAPRVRVVGQTDFGRTPRDWREWVRYESVINEALAPMPLWGLCVYDSRRLPEEVLAAGLRTHPYLVTAQGRRPNPDYEQPADFLRTLPVLAEPLEDSEPLLAADDVTDPAGLRHAVAARLAALGGSPDRTEDLHLAIDEMTSNALRHGRPPVRLRLWGSADRVVCAISDRGAGMDAPFAGYGPAHGQDLSRGGMGLWLARQLCDHVDVIDDDPGLTVRLATSLR
jgi:anti-sigma regulatory factor (Ser/Thr protein kinase)